MPDAAAADVLLALAEDSEGTGLFAVKTDSSGISVTPERGIDQTRKQFRVTFDAAPAQRLAAASPEDVAAVIDDVLIAAAADALGAARAVMDLAVEYAKTRKQFGQPIGSFQAIQHLCVDMYETVELARSGVIHALWASDAFPAADRAGTASCCAAGEGVRRATGHRGRHRHPGVRRHRLHLGARRSSLPQAPAELERISRWARPVPHRTRCTPCEKRCYRKHRPQERNDGHRVPAHRYPFGAQVARPGCARRPRGHSRVPAHRSAGRQRVECRSPGGGWWSPIPRCATRSPSCIARPICCGSVGNCLPT